MGAADDRGLAGGPNHRVGHGRNARKIFPSDGPDAFRSVDVCPWILFRV